MTLPWIECSTICLDADLPFERRYADVPRQAVDSARQLLAALKQEMPEQVLKLAPLVRLRTANRFHREVLAVARMTGTDWRDIMVANISYELVLSAFGCSTMALATADGPVLARNMDWWPEEPLARASYAFRVTRGGRLCWAQAGWPGAVGVVSGMSGRGFAVVLNAVASPEGIVRSGYPVLLHLRRVVEDAAGFDEALQMLSKPRLAASGLFTLVGTRNDQRVVVERTPTRFAQRWPEENEPLLATNDYRLLFRPESSDLNELYRTTCSRFDALRLLLDGQQPADPFTDEQLLYLLTDPRVRQQITAQHVIIRPGQQQLRLFVPRRLVRLED